MADRRHLTLKQENRDVIDFVLDHPRCCIFADMGMGKTLSSLIAADILMMDGRATGPTLVLGPKRVCEDTWPDEVEKWDALADMEISAIVGDVERRRAAMKRDVPIYTCNYEQLPWLVDHYQERWPFRQVVADESTRLKGFRLMGQGGERVTWLGRVAHSKTVRWVNLTATPTPNGLKDLWGQMWFVDRGVRLGRTHGAFMERWFRKKFSGHGVEPMPFAQEQIQAKIADVCITLDPRDYYDIQEPIVNPIRVHMPASALARYKRLEDTMFTELESRTQIEVFNAGSLTNKCLQFANGAVYTKYPEWEAVHNAKLEALESVAEETSVPLLVAYEFKSDLARLKAAFPKGVELATPKGLAAFKTGAAPMGFAHPASMGHGIDGLQTVTNILVRFGHGWDLEQRIQMLGRIGPMRQIQAGFDRPVFVHDLIADGTLDDTVIARHASKQSVMDLLLAACKRRK